MFKFKAKTHLIISVATFLYITTKYSFEIEEILIFLFGTVVGSLFPDCDHKKSLLGHILPLWIFVKHRTITHSFFIIILLIPLAQINSILYSGLILGITTHILSDMLTKTGCPLFYPFIKKKFSLRKI